MQVSFFFFLFLYFTSAFSLIKFGSLQSTMPPAQPSSLVAKAALRKHMKIVLKQTLTPEYKKNSAASSTAALLSSPHYLSPSTIAISVFLSMPNEIDTSTLVKEILANPKKTLYVPRVGSNFDLNNMEMVQVASEEVLLSWPKNRWSIPEPPPSATSIIASPSTLDLIVVPGAAFDKQNNRLGHGRGYYDRYIASLTKRPILLGLAFGCQVVDSVPCEQYDEKLDDVYYSY